MKTRYYIAYGSNLNVEQMQYRCPGAQPVATAMLHGYQLLFKGSKTGSYLTIEEKQGSYVPVAIWAVTSMDEKRLDRYEGFPTFYYKKDFRLTADFFGGGHRQIRCFAYIMHEDRPLGIPSSYYVKTCMQGYRDFGFSFGCLLDALNVTQEGVLAREA